MTQLESSLETSLFRRVGKRLEPTLAAETLHRDFAKYQVALRKAIEGLAAQEGEARGGIRLGAMAEFSKHYLVPRVASFLALFPNIQVKFTFDSPSRLDLLLEEGRIDLSFSIYPHVEKRRFVSRSVLDQELVLVGHQEFFPKVGEPSEDWLKETPVVDYFQNHLLIQRWAEVHLGKISNQFKVVSFGATADVVLELVRSGLGVGVVPRYLAEASQLNWIGCQGRSFMDAIWLRHRPDHSLNRASQLFCQHLLKEHKDAGT